MKYQATDAQIMTLIEKVNAVLWKVGHNHMVGEGTTAPAKIDRNDVTLRELNDAAQDIAIRYFVATEQSKPRRERVKPYANPNQIPADDYSRQQTQSLEWK